MSGQWKIHAAIFAVFAFSGCTSLPSNDLTDTHYEATKHIFLTDVIAPPPVAASVADRQNLNAVLQAQKTRTTLQIKMAQLDATLSVFRFGDVIGDKFTPQNLPVTNAFFEKMKQDEDRVVQIAKIHYNRLRPYTASALVKPVVPQPANASYPSGHACFGYISAILLAKMLPEKAPQIFDRAALFAHNRVIAGAHYPTDIQAGMVSASVIAHALLQDKKFMADFNQAKQELRRVILPQMNQEINQTRQ
jgi:acid phosphatase (class A)